MRPTTVAVFVLTTFALLTGCTQPEPVVTPPTEPTSEPVFASDEEALAAADEAYAAYLEVADAVANDGGRDADRLSTVALDGALEQDVETFSGFVADGLRGVGRTSYDSMSLQSADLKSGETFVYVCVDHSGLDVLDMNGTSVIPPDQPNRLPFELQFRLEASSGNLLLMGSRIWTGRNFC